MSLAWRMPLLAACCLLPFALAGAAGTTVDIATPMPAPEWARLERRILADSLPAVKAFFAKYYDERGYFKHVVRWGANDGPDDAFENTAGWPELHALGASDEILQLHLRSWEGMNRQFTEARTTDVPIGRQGMYYKDFSVQSDWMHHGEALRTFNVTALSAPSLPAYQLRARTYAAFYMGEDAEAPNYDPQHRIIKSMINGSRGPMLRKATSLDWVGDPFDVSKFVALHGENSYEQFLAHYQEYTDVVGDHFLNLVATTLPLNAYLIDNEPKYKRWLVEYMDAWRGADEAERRRHPELCGPRRDHRRARREVVEQRLRLGLQPGEPGHRQTRRPQPDSAGDGGVRQRAARHRRSEVRRCVAHDDRRGQCPLPDCRRPHASIRRCAGMMAGTAGEPRPGTLGRSSCGTGR